MAVEWLPWISTGLVAVLVARWSWLTRQADTHRFIDPIGATLLVIVWHPNIWARFSQGYTGDSLFTLSLAGQIGLVMLTSLLVLLLVSLSRCKSRWLQEAKTAMPGGHTSMPVVDLLLTSLLFVICLTIVPQVFYSYYHLLFDNLPHQWVIKPPSLTRIWHMMSISREASMAMHTTGLCGWWLLTLTVFSWLRSLHLSKHMFWLTAIATLANVAWHHVL